MKTALPLLFSVALTCHALAGVAVDLVRDGRAPLPIFVAPDAPDYVIDTASMLAGKLKQITGAEFPIVRERPEQAVIFTTRTGFPSPVPEKTPRSPWDESYRLLTHDGSLYLTGEGEHSTRNAAYRLLHLLGYRQFFPGAAWEVIPRQSSLSIEVDEAREPAFLWRDLFYALRRSPEQLIEATQLPQTLEALDDWKRKNLADSRFVLYSGHSLYPLIQRHRATFKAHPEWLTTLAMSAQGSNFEPKLLVQHDDLVQLVTNDAVAWVPKNPTKASYSVEPSDRGGWPVESPIGSPSDQVVYLANAVAKRFAQDGIDRRVAFFAYNRHSAPPSLRLEPGIVVSVTTNFIRGVPVRRLLKEWGDKGGEMGVRDYATVWFTDYSLPGNTYMAARPSDFLKTLRSYDQLGIRYYGTEASTGGWLSYGLGMYAATQAFWNPKGVDYDTIYRDFLEKSFGAAAPLVKPFFEKIRGESGPILSDGFYHELYSCLSRATHATHQPDVRTRLAQLIAYTRYVELMDATRQAQGEAKIVAYEKLAEFAIRCRTFSTVPVAEIFGRIGAAITIWDKVGPIGERVMKEPGPIWTPEELFALAAARLETLSPVPFETASYSSDLTTLPGAPAAPASPYRFANRQILHWLVKKPGETLELTVRNISTLDPSQSVYIALTSHDDPDGIPVTTETIGKSEHPATIRLTAPDQGLHDIEIRDAAGESEVAWAAGTAISIPAGAALCSEPKGPWQAWIYIPAGVTRVGGHATPSAGRILDTSGQPLYRFDELKQAGYFNFEITPADHGRFLKLDEVSGPVKFLTIPPYMARRPSEVLLPKEALGPAQPQ